MQTLASNMGGNEMNKLKENFGFDFWQKFGKALMVVIAVMPAAGLMISIGKTIAMINPNAAPLVITGGFLEQIGWGIIGNLHILFALAIGGSWAKERAGGTFRTIRSYSSFSYCSHRSCYCMASYPILN